MKVSDRYDLMLDPETYKTFGREAKAEYQERLPGLKAKKDIIINEANLILADGKKVSVEIGDAIGEQTKQLKDSAEKNAVAGTSAVVTTLSETYNSVASSPTVVHAGEQAGGYYNTAKGWAAEIILNGDAD